MRAFATGVARNGVRGPEYETCAGCANCTAEFARPDRVRSTSLPLIQAEACQLNVALSARHCDVRVTRFSVLLPPARGRAWLVGLKRVCFGSVSQLKN